MKKFVSALILLFAMGAILLTACSDSTKRTTDLSGVLIDGLSLGANISDADLSKYTQSDRYSGDYEYRFNEIVICTDKNEKIEYLFARFDEDYIDITINGIFVQTINDVKETLGDPYQDKGYDKEQHLNEYIFKDKDNNIEAEFIYSSYDGSLLWIVVSR